MRLRVIGLLAAAVGWTVPAAVGQAQTVPAALSQEPSFEQVLEAWPVQARAEQVGGDVDLDCAVSAEGRLEGCRVRAETAPDRGFGAAALALAGAYRYRPATRDGEPAASRTTVRVRFECRERCKPFERPHNFRGPMVAVGWLATPSAADIAAAYPPKARQEGVSGVVTLFCQFDRHGRLFDCTATDRFPRDTDFLRAAVRLAALFRAPAQLADGKPIAGAGVLVPIAFLADPSAVAARAPLIRRPSPEAVAAAYPARAREAAVTTGVGTIRCTVVATGALDACETARETPAGSGLGAAALALAPEFRAALWTLDGQPTVGTSVQAPVRFDAPWVPAPGLPPEVAPRLSAVSGAEWETTGSPEQITAVYPYRANQIGQGGDVRVYCTARADGTLGDCTVAAEAPRGYGFGEAALGLMRHYKLKPRTANGRSVEGAAVTITIGFQGRAREEGGQ